MPLPGEFEVFTPVPVPCYGAGACVGDFKRLVPEPVPVIFLQIVACAGARFGAGFNVIIPSKKKNTVFDFMNCSKF